MVHEGKTTTLLRGERKRELRVEQGPFSREPGVCDEQENRSIIGVVNTVSYGLCSVNRSCEYWSDVVNSIRIGQGTGVYQQNARVVETGGQGKDHEN